MVEFVETKKPHFFLLPDKNVVHWNNYYFIFCNLTKRPKKRRRFKDLLHTQLLIKPYLHLLRLSLGLMFLL